MDSTAMLSAFREDVVDVAVPQLWTDAEIYGYMNDAFYMFVRLTGGIPDYTTDAVCKLTTVVDNPYSALHASILRVRLASNEADGTDVGIINATDVGNLTAEDYGVLRKVNIVTTKGQPRYMIMGLEDGKVRWADIPNAVYNFRLQVDRLPLTPITAAGQAFTGVAAHHHIHFLKWMRHLGYGKQDAETFDKKRSLDEKAAFEEYCGFARRERETSKHKVRVVRYGGL